jgi:hypothetical protein
MFGFFKKKKPKPDVADRFFKEADGGWPDLPDEVAADGGSQADFVKATLEHVLEYAKDNDIAIGETFEFTIRDIPVGISNSLEIILGLTMQADKYGLLLSRIVDETATFTLVDMG